LPDIAISNQRWSVQSTQSYQSMQTYSGPSSPHSTNRSSSMFDRVFSDAGQDSSRPTTPDTEDPGSPFLGPTSSKTHPPTLLPIPCFAPGTRWEAGAMPLRRLCPLFVDRDSAAGRDACAVASLMTA
jgi:hypothetical protein